MQDRIGTFRGGIAAADKRIPFAAWLRMSAVVGGSIATLVALPDWLRTLEAKHPASAQLAASMADPIPVAPPTAATPKTRAAPPASKVAAAVPRGAKQSASGHSPDAAQQRVLADFLAERYRVSRDSLERFVRLAHSAGHITGIDPLLILAVMAVESSFNPLAESVMGAKGLMQIIPEYHRDKLRAPHGGHANVLDPEVNIFAGAKVLREYALRSGYDLTAALRLYGGVGSDAQHPYPNRVLAEWQRLAQFLRGVQASHAGDVQRPAGRA
jgi:soluble lytic murein transglycosylase-like protein